MFGRYKNLFYICDVIIIDMKKTLMAFWVIYSTWVPCVLFHVPFSPFGYVWCVLCIGLLVVINFWPDKPKYVVPEDGRRIKITWLPSCINGEGTPNPYIGMEGVVSDLKTDGSFHLFCGDSWLVGIDKCKFEYTDEQEK
jgi:hypothetical protein